MSKPKRHFSLVIAVVSLFLGAGALAQGVLTPAEVSIVLEKGAITEHEPVIVDIRIQSPPSTSLEFDPGYDWENVQIKVVDPNGHLLVRPAKGLQEGMKFSNAVHIDAGTTDTISVVASDWFKFDERGLYQIEVALRTRSRASGINAKLSLQVEQRDEGSLKTECTELLARLSNSQSFSASLVAAKALSETNDSAAIPYIVEAMKRREFVSLMITALTRLNTDDAVNALIEASKSRDPETSSLARSALASLGR